MSIAQEKVKVDSLKSGDKLIIKKEITIIDLTGEVRVLTPSVLKLLRANKIDDNYLDITIDLGNGDYIFVGSYEFEGRNRRKVKFCR